MTTLDRARHQNSHRFPQFLPDGRHFIFVVRVSGEGAADEVMVGSLEGGPPQPLVKASTNAAFVSGRLLYVRDRALVARRFDPESLRLEGEEVVIGDEVHVLPAASFGGLLGVADGNARLRPRVGQPGHGAPVVRSKRPGDGVGRRAGSLLREFALSPDGRRVGAVRRGPEDRPPRHPRSSTSSGGSRSA